MTSRETETHCVGSYSSDKGSFKNTILVPNEVTVSVKQIKFSLKAFVKVLFLSG